MIYLMCVGQDQVSQSRSKIICIFYVSRVDRDEGEKERHKEIWRENGKIWWLYQLNASRFNWRKLNRLLCKFDMFNSRTCSNKTYFFLCSSSFLTDSIYSSTFGSNKDPKTDFKNSHVLHRGCGFYMRCHADSNCLLLFSFFLFY